MDDFNDILFNPDIVEKIKYLIKDTDVSLQQIYNTKGYRYEPMGEVGTTLSGTGVYTIGIGKSKIEYTNIAIPATGRLEYNFTVYDENEKKIYNSGGVNIHSDGINRLIFVLRFYINPYDHNYWYWGEYEVIEHLRNKETTKFARVPDPNDLSKWYHFDKLFPGGYEIIEEDSTEGNTSYSGGGNGSRNDSTDFIDFPSLPTSSALSVGFVNMVKEPNFDHLKNMLFPKDLISLDTLLYTFYGKPIDYIIGLNILPFSPSTSGGYGGQLGPYEMGEYSIGGSKITQQYQIVDLGEILVDEYFSSALDYAPSSKIEIYLPFVGYRNLNINDVMGKKIAVRYYVDVLTGNFNCMLKVSDRGVLYSFPGNMLTTIPLNGTDFTTLTASLVNLGVSSAISYVTGKPGSAVTSALSNTSNVVSSMTPDITKDGNFGSSMGMLGVKRPFIKKEVPRQSLAKGFSKYRGFPSNLTSKLKNLKGYVEVGEIHLKNISATEEEKNTIVKLLESGVII